MDCDLINTYRFQYVGVNGEDPALISFGFLMFLLFIDDTMSLYLNCSDLMLYADDLLL